MSKVTNHENMRRWIHMHLSKCKSSNGEGEGGSDSSSSSLLMSLIPSSFPKPVKFLAGPPFNIVDVTNYTIDELIQYAGEASEEIFNAVYESSSLSSPIIQGVTLDPNELVLTAIQPSGPVSSQGIPFEGKEFYYYAGQQYN